ncbi:protein of unknown function [Nitrospira japonica]|uniref:Uncharacterized protein n=2 Tax=Nitrospira japonica TaxID=1325564 RepID=A0A1W1IB96_9BACT|nr:protein of unknown function [Nitrospira japonica]
MWLWSTTEEPPRMPLTNVSGRHSAQQGRNDHGSGLHVQLDLLTSSRDQRNLSFVMPRNIFSLPGMAEAAGPSSDAVPDTAQQQQVILTELAQFHYLGFVRKEGGDREKARDLAVLTKNDDVYVAGKGEILENHVIVKLITPDSVMLQDRNSHLEYAVPLSEESASEP